MKQYEGKGKNTKKKERGSMLKAQTTSSKSQKNKQPEKLHSPKSKPQPKPRS
jgi:hypothetical protein